MANIGYFTIILALAIAIYSLMGYILALRNGDGKLLESARGGVLAIAVLITAAAVILIYFLLTSDFSLEYVQSYTSKNLPAFYKFSAFWAGNAGSLLLWLWILVVFSAVVAYSRHPEGDDKVPYVNIILLGNAIFFLLMLIFVTNPFELVPAGKVPLEGRGLNPLLQHPGMVFHPITLYLGYIGFAIPYAYAMAALITRQAGDAWIKITRRWSVVAWLFLTLGNLYGGQWAYVELGWGGYWGWDPVENASFIPWLTATAFIHSVMVQERKDMLKTWNMVLIIITYALTLFGTFLVRSGVLTSVHAFGDSNLGRYFLIFIAIVLAFSLYLLVDRARLLREENEFNSYLSKESSFLVNNLLLVGAAFAVFWGTIFPLISEAIRGVRVTVSVPFFNQVMAPILLATIFVMGICPLIAWQKSSPKNLRRNFLYPLLLATAFGIVVYFLAPIRKPYATMGFAVSFFVLVTIFLEFYRGAAVRGRITGETWGTALVKLVTRNRRRYGGYVVHLGIVLMAFGVIASHAYQQEVTRTVSYGEEIRIGDYTLTYQGLNQRPEGENTVVYADMPVQRRGKARANILPEKVFYATWDQPSTEVAVQGGIWEDLYVALAGWEEGGQTATFKVHVNPMVSWIWLGGYILVLGSIYALWPGRGSGLGPKYSGRG